MEVINEILQKARTQSKLERDAQKKGYKPAKAGPRGTRVKAPRPFMQPKVEPPKVEPTTDEKDKKPIEEAIDKAAGTTNKKARQKKGGTQWHQRAPGARSYDPSFTPSEVDTTRSSTSDEIARQRATTIGDPTQIKKPTTPQSDDPSANTPNPKKTMDKANGDPPVPRKSPEIFTPTSGQTPPVSGPDTGASTGPGVWDSMKRQFGSTAGAAKGIAGQAAGATREVVGRGAGAVATGGRQAIEVNRERLGEGAKRMGDLFSAGKKRASEVGRAIGRGAETARGNIAEGGRAIRQDAATVRGNIAEGGRKVGRRAVAGAKEARLQGREFGAGLTGKQKDVRMRSDPDWRIPERRRNVRGGAAYRLGQRTRGAGKEIREGVKAGAHSAREFGEGVGQGFGSYDRDARTFDRERSGGEGPHGKPSSQRRSGSRRIGQLFGATGRATGELAGEGVRGVGQEAGRFGRGVARGATPGKTGSDWRDRETAARRGDVEALPDVRGTTPRSASERAGQWLGRQGRERTADVLDITGQTPRGFGRGIQGKQGQEEYGRGDASATEKLGRWMGEGVRGAGRGIPQIGSEARRDRQMLRDEGVGKGINFQPNAHRGASLSEKHKMATGLADRVNARQNMSPKEWMEVIHHMSQTPDGQRYANFSDINMNNKDWNKPISFGDMRQHLDRMNVSHGTHGDTGKRGFDKLVNKLTNVASGSDRGGLKFHAPKLEDEGQSPDPNYNREQQQEEETRRGPRPSARRRRNPRQRRTEPRDSSAYYEGSFPVMNSTDYQSKNSVTDTFKRAFNMPTSKGA